jgi:hypothetical protein
MLFHKKLLQDLIGYSRYNKKKDVIYQDNKSIILLESNGRKKQARDPNTQFRQSLKMVHCQQSKNLKNIWKRRSLTACLRYNCGCMLLLWKQLSKS